MKISTKMLGIGVAALFVLLALPQATTVAHGGFPRPYPCIEMEDTFLPTVKIIALTTIVLPPGGYLDYTIYWRVQNFRNHNVTAQLDHTLILPDETSNTSSGIWTIPENMAFGAYFDCVYETDLYGEYTYVLTVKNSFGTILDTKSVSWEREACF